MQVICENCGNDDATEGYNVCSDCIEIVPESEIRRTDGEAEHG